MPGLSFLFKKKWHPSRKDNQEKVFIKEQTSIYDKSKEEEAAREVAKEAELQSYVRGGDIGDRDPRTSSLKFMYAQPTKSGDASSSSSISMEPQKPQVGEDEDVKRFWKKLKGDFKHEDDAFDVKMAESREFSSTNATSSSKTFRTQSALEKQVGKKTGELLNRSELEARHPRLKNAPVEGGAYTAQMHLNHKPFLDVIRNVRCLRCGEWGHALGDRECSLLHEVSAHDLARQRQEDPVNAMRREEVIEQKQRLVLRQALACPQNKERATYYGGQADNQQLLSSEEEGIVCCSMWCQKKVCRKL